jgi:hypothetical protein
MRSIPFKTLGFSCLLNILLLLSFTTFAQNVPSVEGDLMGPVKKSCYSWKTVYSSGPYEVKYCASVDDPLSKSWKTVVYFQSTFPESAYLILHADVRHKDGEFMKNKSIAGGNLYRGNDFQDYDMCDYVSFYNERIKYLKIGDKIIYDEFQRKW